MSYQFCTSRILMSSRIWTIHMQQFEDRYIQNLQHILNVVSYFNEVSGKYMLELLMKRSKVEAHGRQLSRSLLGLLFTTTLLWMRKTGTFVNSAQRSVPVAINRVCYQDILCGHSENTTTFLSELFIH